MTQDAVEPGGAAGRVERAERSPTLSDVSRAYRLFLGREVESVAVAGGQIAAAPSLWTLVERFYSCAEAHRRRLGEAAAAMAGLDDRRPAPVNCTPGQLARIVDAVEADWARRGVGALHHWLERDLPLYDDRSVAWNIARRFDLGMQEAATLQALCAATGVPWPEAPAVAVFGVDAYRLAEAFRGGRYVGIEPRPDDLTRGRAALADRGLDQAELVTVAQFRRCDLRYDLFYSVMALQYAPPPMAHALLRRGLEQIRPGGLAFVQFAGHVHDYSFDAAAYLAGQGRDPHGELHALPQHQVLGLLAELGFAPVEVKPDGRLSGAGLSYSVLAHRRL